MTVFGAGGNDAAVFADRENKKVIFKIVHRLLTALANK